MFTLTYVNGQFFVKGAGTVLGMFYDLNNAMKFIASRSNAQR